MKQARSTTAWLFLAGLTLLICAVGLLQWSPNVSTAGTADKLEIRTSEEQGKIRLDWDGKAELVRKADSATLDVRDGETFNSYPLASRVLQQGGLDYARRSDDVSMKLTLVRAGKPVTQASVLSVSGVEPELRAAATEPTITRKPKRRTANEGSRARSRSRRR